jgi:two-component system, OmpR family, sensor histidine kinase KdpD
VSSVNTRAWRSRVDVTGVAVRIVASAAAVAGITIAIAVLREWVPVLSLGVLYLFAVLPVAARWGLAYAVPVAVASMAAFNWFFLHPAHTFRLSDGANWLALAVYVATAIVVSGLAARARRRAAEAEQREREEAFLAELSTALLHGTRVEDELDRISSGAAAVLGGVDVRIELGSRIGSSPEERVLDLVAGDRTVGALVLAGEAPGATAHDRFLSSLASLLAVALDRERLAREVLEAEALRQSDAIKTAVLRAVSHDLRTPLTAIRVAAEGLSSDELDLSAEDRAGLLDAILSETARLQRVVGDLLDLSRLQAGVATPDPDVWTVDELLSQAIDGLGPDADRVDVTVPDSILPVRVDAIQIERVLANLLDNALKYSPPEARVHVDVGREPTTVVIRVADSGPGIRPAELEEIFEPFRTGAGRDRRGSGLGLAIARGFADANGGRVWAEPHSLAGATFALALPAVESRVPIAR